MDQLQGKLYKLLVELDEICKRNQVTYYLAGGTALGSIRGGGFLPWDDDIDLYITRENWNKLVKVMETETPENRIFVCDENTDLYWNPVGRYVDKNTTVMMKSQLLCGKACGQLIEFFIMDPMPKDEKGKWEHRRYLKAYTELLSPYFVVNRNILSENIDFDYKLYNKYYWKSIFFGREKVLNELLSKITSVSEEDSDCYCMRWGMRTLMYGKDLLAEPRMEKFEEGMFPVPAKQEEVARIAYGDSWMYVPEGTGKVVHNLNKDLTTPFQEYVDLYMPLLDKETLLHSYKKNKRIRAKALYNKNLFIRKFALAKVKLAGNKIQTDGYDLSFLRQLLEEKNFKELTANLEQFYTAQFNPTTKTEHLLVPVEDDYLAIAIMNYVLQGAYYKINSILVARKAEQRPFSDSLQEAADLVQFCKELSVAVFDKRDFVIVDELLQNHEQYANVLVDYGRALLWSMTQKASTTNEYEAIVQEAKKQIERFGEDGEIVRFEAYALYQLGQKEHSEERYKVAIEDTRNGYVWKEAMELFGIDAYDLLDNQHENEDEGDENENSRA